MKQNFKKNEGPSPINITKRFSEVSINETSQDSFQGASFSYPPASGSASVRGREIDLFLRASELEREGEIADAIKLYEQAYRLNPDVDRLAAGLEAQPNTPLVPPLAAGRERETKGLQNTPKFQITVPDLFEEVSLALSPIDYAACELPDDLVRHILTWVGVLHAPSLEEFARTCRKFFLISRDKLVWRQMYLSSRAAIHMATIDKVRIDDWRDAFFREPRVRTDGIYICKISYFRPGVTNGAFFQPVHLVTYYRYLRFFPRNYGFSVALLVTTQPPKDAISLLKRYQPAASYIPFGVTAEDLVLKQLSGTTNLGNKPLLRDPSFRKSNLFLGRYFRIAPNDDEFHLCLYDPQAGHNSLFSMVFRVSSSKSLSGGGNTIITCNSYGSVNIPATTNGEPLVFPIDVRNWGNFLFSRVRSYHV